MLLRRPRVRLLAEEEGFWDVYREVTDGLVGVGIWSRMRIWPRFSDSTG
jgi:hypothetical protein